MGVGLGEEGRVEIHQEPIIHQHLRWGFRDLRAFLYNHNQREMKMKD